MRRLTLTVLTLLPLQAFAGPSIIRQLAEPGTLELLSLGVVVVVIAAIRRRK